MSLPPSPPPSVCGGRSQAERLASVVVTSFDNPKLREALLKVQARDEQIIDTISQDSVLAAGWDTQAREKARQTVTNFRQFLEEHRDEITALQIFYSQPRSARLTERDLKQLAAAIAAPPLGLTTGKLWQAYETLKPERVRNGTKHLLADLVSLVRYTMVYDTDDSATLEPYRETVNQRFAACYHPENRHQRQESERFHSFTYDELLKRDKLSLDLFWLRDESLEGTDKLPPPGELAASIVEDLQNALEQFMAIAEDLGGKVSG